MPVLCRAYYSGGIMKTDYDSGVRGLKQIWKSMVDREDTDKFEEYTSRFLERQGFFTWFNKIKGKR